MEFMETEKEEKIPLFRINLTFQDGETRNCANLFSKAEEAFKTELEIPKPKPKKKETKVDEKVEEKDPIKEQARKNDRFLNIIFNIEKRERETKTAIIRSQPKKKEKSSPSKSQEERKKKTDAYESDDSWIDDSEYSELVILEDEGEEAGKTFHSSDEEEGEEGEENNTEKDEEKEEKKKEVALHPEMEDVLKHFEEKSKEIDFKNKSNQDKLHEELLKIAICRVKNYPKGVIQPITNRIQSVLSLTPQTIKKKLTDLYNTHMSKGLQGKEEIEKKKEKLKKEILEDIKTRLKKDPKTLKLEKSTKSSEDGNSQSQFSEASQNEFSQTEFSQPQDLANVDVNELKPEKIFELAKKAKLTQTTPKEVIIALGEVCDQFELNIKTANELKEKGIDVEVKDFKKELPEFLKELSNYWPHPEKIQKKLMEKYEKYKKEKEEKEKKDKEEKEKKDKEKKEKDKKDEKNEEKKEEKKDEKKDEKEEKKEEKKKKATRKRIDKKDKKDKKEEKDEEKDEKEEKKDEDVVEISSPKKRKKDEGTTKPKKKKKGEISPSQKTLNFTNFTQGDFQKQQALPKLALAPIPISINGMTQNPPLDFTQFLQLNPQFQGPSKPIGVTPPPIFNSQNTKK